MIWSRRKSGDGSTTPTDPQIQNARQILESRRHAAIERQTAEHTDHAPAGIDSDFCYEEDNTRCA